MQIRDEQPSEHRLGKRVLAVAEVEPLDVDGVRTVAVGSAIWLVAFLALLPFTSRLADADRLWWLWACLAGFGLGLFGYEYCRRRRRARHAEH
ncbi:DUF2530 domain-containing protein [Nocardioides limicola]|uniref:DUF2530 domain-containing protein n=1 Tax=Nocardioides limicola TaxID=2803368 RepID=UPI0027DDA9A9|nr:DUF2530 domain-containing protein [Nocardioides sp. DJM-14]